MCYHEKNFYPKLKTQVIYLIIFNEFVYKNQFTIEIDIYIYIYIYNLLNKITKKNAMQDCIY